MNTEKYLAILQDKIGVAVFATINEEQQPDSRYINIGVANDQGIFYLKQILKKRQKKVYLML